MDYTVFRALNNFAYRHDWIEDPIKLYVSVSKILFVLLLVALFFAIRRGHAGRLELRRTAVAAGAALALAVVVGAIISKIVDRSRPFVDHPHVHKLIAHAADSGFPSDHATASFAIGIAILLRNRLIGTIVLVFALILSIGRVMLGIHYPGDVVGGAAIGGLCALLLWLPWPRRQVDRLADQLSFQIDRGLARVVPSRA